MAELLTEHCMWTWAGLCAANHSPNRSHDQTRALGWHLQKNMDTIVKRYHLKKENQAKRDTRIYKSKNRKSDACLKTFQVQQTLSLEIHWTT